MTPSLLSNELVRKYFFKIPCPHNQDETLGCTSCMAFNVLTAMQEPIKKGEKYLASKDTYDVTTYGNFVEVRVNEDDISDYFHPYLIRLPDRFQSVDAAKCEHRHELGGCHKILGCPPNAWDGDKPSCVTNEHIGDATEKVQSVEKECDGRYDKHQWVLQCETCGKNKELDLSCPLCGETLAPKPSPRHPNDHAKK